MPNNFVHLASWGWRRRTGDEPPTCVMLAPLWFNVIQLFPRAVSTSMEAGLPDDHASGKVSKEIPDDDEHVLGTKHVHQDPCLRGHRPRNMRGDAAQH